ncbi:MAG: CRISPR-associated endonuclease Cas3'', partial [Dehalococcoidia bacterium]|nr:CRISPR-associated endonuclease Cas3'' [Dehalococcoidia bacterium]
MPEAPRPAVWPTAADRLLAKPRPKTPSDPPAESLPTHTWRVLSRLAELARLQPDLPARVGDERLWHRLYWACFLHDFGKAASGFQALMTSRKRWGLRHEALSLAFVAWLTFTEDDRLAIIAAIASHHKDHDEFWRQHNPPARDVDPEDDEDSDVSHLCRDLRSEHRDALWDWLDRCRGAWVTALGLPGVETPELCPKDVAAKRVSPTAIYRAVRRYHDWVETLDERDARSERRRSIILRGLIMLADHTGSAAPETPAFTPLALDPARIMAGKTPNEHQQQLATVDGHAILVAPTGSGKTEAALLWAARQQAQTGAPRLFYTLPYQASLNAMRDRLEGALGPDTVSLQHGRALQAIYRRLLTADLDDSPGAVEAAARARSDYGRLAVTPARALSPYQLLKALFRLDGYEKMMTDATGGVFVLDEVHAYEPARLALFVTLLQALVADYGA